MAITAKVREVEQIVRQGEYELFEDVEVMLKDGSVGIVEKSLGIYTLARLEAEKAHGQKMLDDAQKKIDAINLIK